MILHAAEIWVSLAVCFALGGLLGSILQRAIALTALGRPQATLIRGIDRVIRWLDRRILPWRGTVPAVLPQTVPVPPPDFGHRLDPATEPDAGEAASPRFTLAPPVEHDESGSQEVAPAVRAAPAASQKQTEAIARGDGAGFRPLPLSGPRHGQADPLYLIQGVTKRHVGRLAQVGIFHFSQIASWTPQEVAWIAAYLGAGEGPVEKDWVGQAVHFAGADEPLEVLARKAAVKRTTAKNRPVGDQPLRRKTGAEPKPRSPKPKRRSKPKKKAEPAMAAGKAEEGGE